MKKWMIVYEGVSYVVEADKIMELNGHIELHKGKEIVAIAPLTALVCLRP